MKSKRLLVGTFVFLAVVYIAGLVHFAQVRPVDGDEGYYTTAARLVWEGRTPYRDFFYQQAPLLPYLYSWVWAIHPRSLVSMRLLSAAFGGTAILLWGFCLPFVKRLPAAVTVAVFAAILFNPYWFSWNAVVKTYAAATLLVSGAMISSYVAVQSGRLRWYFSAGLALGIVTSLRSLYGPLILFVLVWIFCVNWRRSASRFSKSLSFLGGAICGLLPMIFSFLRDPSAFFFNNVQYHRLDAGYIWQNGSVIVGYGGLRNALFEYFVHVGVGLLVFHPYFTLEVVLAIVGGVSLLRLRKSPDPLYSNEDYEYLQLTLVLLIAYTAAALIPFPPYEQYFDGPLVPFLIPFLAEGLRVTFRAGMKRTFAVGLAALALFFVEIKTESAWNSMKPQWRVSSYRKVTEAVEANSSPDDVVLSFWPGYVFESGRKYFPGLENNFTNRITGMVGPEARSRYHLLSKDQVMNAVCTRAVGVLVFASPSWMVEYYSNLSASEKDAFHAAVEANYSLISDIDEVAIYRRNELSRRAALSNEHN
jgi:Dolichyl-phosphate-mannose-protein mannosyltransferase